MMLAPFALASTRRAPWKSAPFRPARRRSALNKRAIECATLPGRYLLRCVTLEANLLAIRA